jgi:hypothetical protein
VCFRSVHQQPITVWNILRNEGVAVNAGVERRLSAGKRSGQRLCVCRYETVSEIELGNAASGKPKIQPCSNVHCQNRLSLLSIES